MKSNSKSKFKLISKSKSQRLARGTEIIVLNMLLSLYLVLSILILIENIEAIESIKDQFNWRSLNKVPNQSIRRRHSVYPNFESSSLFRGAINGNSNGNTNSGLNEDLTTLNEDPVNEIVFSNQTGLVIPCRVALELAKSIEKAERKQQQLNSARTTNPTTGIDIQIRWEKDNGEPIETILNAHSSIDGVGTISNEDIGSTSQMVQSSSSGSLNGDQVDEDSASSSSSSSSSSPSSSKLTRKILRQIRASDGALVFEPFKAQDFRTDVHLATYRCIAWSESRGASISSRDFQVKASLISIQHSSSNNNNNNNNNIPSSSTFQPEVLDELVIEGNNALFRCTLPFHARDHFQVLDWIEYPSETVHSLQSTTLANANIIFHNRPNSINNNRRSDLSESSSSLSELNNNKPSSDGLSSQNQNQAPRYFVAPKGGDLHILNVDSSFNDRSFKCRAKNKLTGEIIVSSNRGKLIVTESRSSVSPRPVLDTQSVPVYLEGQLALLACNQQASPRAQVIWSKKIIEFPPSASSQSNPLEILKPIDTSDPKSSGFAQLSGLLLINRVHRNHSGMYVCQAKNTAGEERLEFELQVREPLRAKLSVSSNVLELGKSLALDCTVSGYPVHQIVFKHNLNIIKSISGSQGPSIIKSTYRGSSSNSGSQLNLNSRPSRPFHTKSSTSESSSSSSSSVISHDSNSPTQSGSYFVVDDVSQTLQDSNDGLVEEQAVSSTNSDTIRSVSSGSNGPNQLLSGSVEDRMRSALANSALSSSSTSSSSSSSPSTTMSMMNERTSADASSNSLIGAQSNQVNKNSYNSYNNHNNNRQHQNFDVSYNLSHIIVIVLEPQHTGAYQCFAYNQYESVQSSAYIRVLDDPPKFKDTFRSQVIDKYQDLSLQCSARANPLPEITWSVDDQPIPESSRIRFGDFVTKDNLVISYVNISRAEVFDTGQYKCVADNGLAQVSHEAQINVAGPLQVKPMNNLTVLASTSFRIRCPVAGYPLVDIRWHHNGRRLPANHRQRVFENGTLEVDHMERSQNDHGLYTCLASSVPLSAQQLQANSGSEQQSTQAAQMLAAASEGLGIQSGTTAVGSVYVSIKAKPTIDPFTISRSLREGQRASITCTISSGDLPIQITWFRNDRPLQVEGQLDTAPYEAQYQSVVGQHHHHHHHHHHLRSGLTQRQVAIGEEQNNNNNNILSGIRVNRGSDYSSTLFFESLLVQHSGNYTCLARNEAGSSSHQASMIVQVAPKWIYEPVDSSVIRGESISINCVASGFPPPRVIWTKAAEVQQGFQNQDQGGVQSKSQQQIGSWVYENGSLNILDARDNDLGYYMCQASNGVGPGLSKVIKVTIHVAVQFNLKNSVQFVIRGEQTQLRCPAKGDAPIVVHWFRGKNRLQPMNVQEQSSNVVAAGGSLTSSSSTLASVLLVQGGSGAPTASTLAQLRNSIQPPISLSFIDQLAALLPASSQQQEPNSKSFVMPRYSLAINEQPLDSSSGQVSESGTNRMGGVHQSVVSDVTNRIIQQNSVLRILSADPSDTNSFRCIAANHYGVDERVIQLIVQDKPDRVEELTVVEANSRSIVLGWLAPHDGNSPISSYQILYRPAPLTNVGLPAVVSGFDGLEPDSSWFNYTLPISPGPQGSNYPNSSSGTSQASNSYQKPLLHAVSQPMHQMAGSGGRTVFKISINSLRPLTQYLFRVGAENKLGHGPLSRTIEAATQEEAPGAAPLDLKAIAQSSSTILVSWSKLNDKDLFGPVHGYYIAYKMIQNSETGSEDPIDTSGQSKVKHMSNSNEISASSANSIYKTVPHDDKLNKFDALLTGLKKSTRYAITVSAYNARGMGPSSEPIIVRTLEMDPPRQVRLQLKQATNNSIELEWRPLSSAALEKLNVQQQQQLSQNSKSMNKFDANQPSLDRRVSSESLDSSGSNNNGDVVDSYTLFRADFSERPRWIETNIPGSATSHQIVGLQCGMHYQFYMIGVNRIGRSEQSAILDTKTVGAPPKAPERQLAFEVINTTCYIIRLDHWNDNSCPIHQFSVRYRDESKPRNEWTQLVQIDLNQQKDPSKHPNETRVVRNKRWGGPIDEASEEPMYSLDYPSLAAADAATVSLDQLMFSDYSPSSLQDSQIELEMIEDTDSRGFEATGGSFQRRNGVNMLKSSILPAFDEHDDKFNSFTESLSLNDARSSDSDELPKTKTVQRSVSDQPLSDWRHVRLCNLNPNVPYVVQVYSANGVGGTDSEFRLLTSSEGIEYDPDFKRQVVSKFGSGGRLAPLSFSVNRPFEQFLSLHQWPVFIPVAILMVSFLIIVSFLLKRAQMGSQFGSSSSASLKGSKDLDSDRHSRTYISADPHQHDLNQYRLHQSSQFDPPPSSSISEAAATIAPSGCNSSEMGDAVNGQSSQVNGNTYAMVRACPDISDSIYQQAEAKIREEVGYGAMNCTLRQMSPQNNFGIIGTLPHNHQFSGMVNQVGNFGTNTLPHNHHHLQNGSNGQNQSNGMFNIAHHSLLGNATLPHNQTRARNVFLCSSGLDSGHSNQFYGLINEAQDQHTIYGHHQTSAFNQQNVAAPAQEPPREISKGTEVKNYSVPTTLFHTGINQSAFGMEQSEGSNSLVGESSTSGISNTASSQSGPMTKQQYDDCFMSIVEEVARATDSLNKIV